jgi:hypothetical protein
MKWKKFLAWVAGIVIVAIGFVIYFNYYAVFSDGYRAGTLIKFSRKGFVFKTYEGELNQGGVVNPVPGTAMVNQIWKFSVKSDKVANDLMKLEGQTVRLRYKQYLKMFPWEGETEYLVNDVELVE